MQRRFGLALALTALASVLLVGLGMLLLAGAGARRSAEQQITAQLGAIGELATGDRSVRDFRGVLVASESAFDFDAVEVVVIDGQGRIEVIPVFGRSRPGLASPRPVFDDPGADGSTAVLDDDQLARFDDGEIILLDGDQSVIGVRQLDVRFRELGPRTDARIALAARQRVLALPSQAVSWFLVSSAVVLAGSLIAAAWLARRFVHPIRSMQETTAAIAGGDLSARATVAGDDEVADLGHSVNLMAAELQRSRTLDQQFLMSVSHDLRTPLTAISGYAEALADGTASDGKAIGTIIHGQAGRLERLVQDLLDLARLDANQFQLQLRPVDLAVVAGRTTAEFEPKATEQSAQLDFTHSPGEQLMVEADPDRLAQVIGNLIDNGLKFAESSVKVDVAPNGPSASVTVTDDGPGVADEDVPHIFDRLYSGQSQPERAESSIGLGLTIVRELLAAMGGRIEVENITPTGSRFRLDLPLISGAAQDRDP